MKVVLVKENDTVRLLEGNGKIGSNVLAMRTRLTSGEIKYYELDYTELPGCSLAGYMAAINMFPDLLETAKAIKAII